MVVVVGQSGAAFFCSKAHQYSIPALKASKLPQRKNLEQPNQSLDLSQTEML